MIARLQRWIPGARWLVIAPPYVWLLLFFAVPFAISLKATDVMAGAMR